MELILTLPNRRLNRFEKLASDPKTDVNFADAHQMTALNYCAITDLPEQMKMLLARPDLSVVNLENSKGMTPLMSAAMRGHSSAVEVLLKSPDLDINKQNGSGQTALIYAAHHGHVEVVRMLLRHPAIDEKIADNQGKTAYDWAVEKDHDEVRQILSLEASFGRYSIIASRMFRAVMAGDESTLKLCLKYPHLYVNQSDAEGWTPLHRACKDGHVSTVATLLQHEKIDVNRTEGTGKTSLMIASSEGHVEVVELLLQHPEIGKNYVDIHGKTALDLAMENGKPDVVTLLQDGITNQNGAVYIKKSKKYRRKYKRGRF